MKKIFIGILFLLLLLFLTIIHGYHENRTLEVENLTISLPNLPNNLDQLKIVHLSDIHFPNNRIDPAELIAETKKVQPDLIFLTGDLMDRSADISQIPLADLIASLSEIAPTYSVSGNHETSSEQLEEWNAIMVQNGAVLLENEMELITIAEEQLAIVGLEDWSRISDVTLRESIEGLPVLLLAHHPEFFNSYLTDNPTIQPDITFSGHAHGGQIRLPFIGPLFAPGQGFFPDYTSGIYESPQNTHQKLVVSRGIGNSLFPLRINNKPHFIIITLTNE
ncbi:metallophosphoesterase [Desemzia sp. RIT804]|uniref:metallophosphoesterase n=1 Tax=Desemzia sp. RIT 804 TaxID=2810209 RepID=UPI0019512A11|nr:metallophosphoesterase [Desemzia sp. RIT 804]MBM6614400.1 metallophosphoesterase [Desemzia sp. RIT 804]